MGILMLQSKVSRVLAVVVVCSSLAAASSAPVPKVFPGETDWGTGSNATPAFTPDGKTVFFTHWHDGDGTVMVSYLRGGKWSKPEAAPFSGRWRDLEPAMAPDGSYLVFASNRPAMEGGKAIDGFFQGKTQPGKGGNLWRVNWTGNGWSKPVRLPDEVNSNTAIYSPSVARSGNLYFNQSDPITKKERLSWSQLIDGHYTAPEPVSFDDGVTTNFTAAVAPDESFILFSGHRAPSPEHQAVVFVAFAENQRWKAPVPFQPFLYGEQERLSPDLKTLYFVSDRPRLDTTPNPNPSVDVPMKIWQISLEGWAVLGK
jgi:Tol biopolymer transport system component